MSAQFDFNAGLDPSALTSITQAQLLQMIQQIVPLSNIGGVIFQAGTSLGTTIAQGTGGSPDVTNNPRFARYLWLNTFSAASAAPTPYYYDASTGNWTLVSVAAGSIVNASISATAEIAVSKLADGGANEIISTNADGVTVNWTSIASLLAALNDSVPLTAIDDTAAVGATSFLRRDGSTVVWKTFAETVTAIQAALSGVAPSVFTPGSNNTLLGTNGSGVVAFNTPANILANEAITLALIAQGGASSRQVLLNTGSAWAPTTIPFTRSSGAVTSDALAAGSLETLPHTLTIAPKLIDVFLVNNTGGAVEGWAAGEEIPIYSVNDSTSETPSMTWYSDATNVYVRVSDNANFQFLNKTTGAYGSASAKTGYFVRVYCYA